MRIAVSAFTKRGVSLAWRLSRCLAQAGDEVSLCCPIRMAGLAASPDGAGAVSASACSKRPEAHAPAVLLSRPVGATHATPADGWPQEGESRAHESVGAWAAWASARCDALVFVSACGIAVRAIAPHVRDKLRDPAVVCMDEAGEFVVPLLSGHVGGANELARHLARIVGGRAAISTATDVNGVFAVDSWAASQGLAVLDREVAKEVSAALLEREPVGFASEFAVEGELPVGLVRCFASGPASRGEKRSLRGSFINGEEFQELPEQSARSQIEAVGENMGLAARDGTCSGSDRAAKPCGPFVIDAAGVPRLGISISLSAHRAPFERSLRLVPKAITVGVGCKRGTPAEVIATLVDRCLAEAGLPRQSVACLASIDRKADEPGVLELARMRGWCLRFHAADELAAVPGSFSSSDFVRQTVGVDNVCERAACAEGEELVLPRRAQDGVTVALAQRSPSIAFDEPCADPPAAHRLVCVGLGPGASYTMTYEARAALDAADVIVGYSSYIDLIRADYPHKELLVTPMRKEVERCRLALTRAAEGARVAMVCSGDPGVYGMAGLLLELAPEYPGVEVEVVPGVSAANAGAAVLGAPLMHDWCTISLSDLMTPWETIERRLTAAAQADFCIALYNPSSHRRPDHLRRACDILLAHRDPRTACGYVRAIGRAEEQAVTLTLRELRDAQVDMLTCVFVGNTQTRLVAGRMVTPRGYLQRSS